jgi:signal transduction histidine kinase
MAVSDWLRPPRHLVVLFLGIALILVSTLAWLGWKLFQQDRALERQRVQVRLEHAADLVAAEMDRRLGSIEEQLARLATVARADLPDSAERVAGRFSPNTVTLVLTGDDLAAYPSGRLLYYPTVSPAPAPDARVYAPGEVLEFRRGDLAGAARAYRRIAQSGDFAVRAGALLRLARAVRKAGRFGAALDAYHALAALGSTPAGGVPAELVARHARLAILDTLSRSDELRGEAAALHADLAAGRWRLTRAQFEFHLGEVCRWTECPADSGATRMSAGRALAAGAEWVWSRRRTLARDGRELSWFDRRPVLAVWRSSTERTVALVGGPVRLAEDWVGGLDPMLRRQNVRIALSDVRGNRLTPPVGSASGTPITRTVAETRLPWTLQVASADPAADLGELAQRRRLMLLGLATLSLLVVVGLYAVVRGVNRELEVARLQSDFVAAVSHEFRTPLTSLRQLAELLSGGRVASEERRARYYDVMARESGRLHRLVEGLLDFGRMEAGALEFSWERVEPSGLVRSVVAEFEAEVAETGCRVELTADAAAPAVRADREALGRAVWNLLDNAVKYSPDRKTVWVEVSQTDGRVRIAVRDEGAGIPAAQREAIFRKFVRGTSADGRGAKGTGIGLAMVKHIVEAHGGEVRVESEVGRGSTFTILLPVEA